MCFVLEKGNEQPRAAEKDKFVFKCGTIRLGAFIPYFFRTFVYKRRDVQPSVALLCIAKYGLDVIEEGYHAYITPEKGTNALMMIPKGTKYYINNEYNEIVAETMVYWGKFNWIRRLFLKWGRYD